MQIHGEWQLEQSLILAANYPPSHILHFYQLAALDFVDVTALVPGGCTQRPTLDRVISYRSRLKRILSSSHEFRLNLGKKITLAILNYLHRFDGRSVAAERKRSCTVFVDERDKGTQARQKPKKEIRWLYRFLCTGNLCLSFSRFPQPKLVCVLATGIQLACRLPF